MKGLQDFFYYILITFTFIHLADAFIQSDLQLRNTISDTLYRGKQTKEVLVMQMSRHCSEQILARQWEVKGKSKVKERELSFFFF